MPHKHRLAKANDGADRYNLPPSKDVQFELVEKPSKSKKRKHISREDDTPRAFTRLLTTYRPPRSGLDDGMLPSKKRKTSKAFAEGEPTMPPRSHLAPTIQPQEPLSSFNARVDAALSFAGLSKRSSGGQDIDRARKTKTEKKMQKMQREWREEERRRKEKLEEQADEARVDEDGIEDMLKTERKHKRKGGKRKQGDDGMIPEDDDDPWAHIKAKRLAESDEKGGSGLVGLHDVVLAPPKFSRMRENKENEKVGVGGGLKRQAELSEARQRVIDGYRQMMKEKRTQSE